MNYILSIDDKGSVVVFDIALRTSVELDAQALRRIKATAEAKTYEAIVRDAAVLALREIAEYAGYQTLERGQQAIKADLNKEYITKEELGTWLAEKSKGRKDHHIWKSLAEGKLGPYRKYAKQRGFAPLEYASEIDPQAVRNAHKRKMSIRKVRAFIKKSQEKAYIRTHGDRVGVIGGGVFWDAAKKLNPKARPKGLARIKTKAQRKIKGSERNTTAVRDTPSTVVAEIIGSHNYMGNVHDMDGIIRRALDHADEFMRKEIMIRDLNLDAKRKEAEQ